MYLAPSIDSEGGESWRDRSLSSWMAMAERDGYRVRTTDDAGQPRPVNERATWCGNVRVFHPDFEGDPGMVYRVHRGPRRRISSADSWGTDGQFVLGWIVQATTYVLPVFDEPGGVDSYDA